MKALKGKNVLICVSGGIAAYKIPLLVRLLKVDEFQVRLVISKTAKDFVSPLVLSTLSELPVEMDMININNNQISWNNHVEIAKWADVILVAPATSNTIAKYVNGICDNLLLAVLLSSKCSKIWAPAMDLDMFNNMANQSNLEKLKSWGDEILPSPTGFLASGLNGPGRMQEPKNIHVAIRSFFLRDNFWINKKILLTSGPTREAIDPVRFLSNGSSGLTGVSLVKALSEKGAKVFWVHGPSNYHYEKFQNVIYKPVISAIQMNDEVLKHWSDCDIFIGAAAVSDYRPVNVSKIKIKKNNGSMSNIELKENPDILSEVGKRKTKKQFVLGFALESKNGEVEAERKLIAKNADVIVLNYANSENIGIAEEENIVTLVTKNSKHQWPLLSKKDIAVKLIEWIQKNSNE